VELKSPAVRAEVTPIRPSTEKRSVIGSVPTRSRLRPLTDMSPVRLPGGVVRAV
jgi:hypothetical protein